VQPLIKAKHLYLCPGTMTSLPVWSGLCCSAHEYMLQPTRDVAGNIGDNLGP